MIPARLLPMLVYGGVHLTYEGVEVTILTSVYHSIFGSDNRYLKAVGSHNSHFVLTGSSDSNTSAVGS